MRPFIIAAVTAIALSPAAIATSAFASDDSRCTTTEASTWLSMGDLEAKAKDLGYDVRKMEIEGTCVEVYAIDKDGKKVEAYLDPSTGAVVRTKVKS